MYWHLKAAAVKPPSLVLRFHSSLFHILLKGASAPTAPVLMACLATELQIERRKSIAPSLYHSHLNSQENRGYSGVAGDVQLLILQYVYASVCVWVIWEREDCGKRSKKCKTSVCVKEMERTCVCLCVSTADWCKQGYMSITHVACPLPWDWLSQTHTQCEPQRFSYWPTLDDTSPCSGSTVSPRPHKL